MDSNMAVDVLEELKNSHDLWDELNPAEKAAFYKGIDALKLVGILEKFLFSLGWYKLEWVPVEEGLPPSGDHVLVTIVDDSGDTPYTYSDTGWYANGMWVVDNEPVSGVCKWAKIPKEKG